MKAEGLQIMDKFFAKILYRVCFVCISLKCFAGQTNLHPLNFMPQKLAEFNSISFDFIEEITEYVEPEHGIGKTYTQKIFGSFYMDNNSGNYRLHERVFSAENGKFLYESDTTTVYKDKITTMLFFNGADKFVLDKDNSNALKAQIDTHSVGYIEKFTPIRPPLPSILWTFFQYGQNPVVYSQLLKGKNAKILKDSDRLILYYPDTGIKFYFDKSTHEIKQMDITTTSRALETQISYSIKVNENIKTKFGVFPRNVEINLCEESQVDSNVKIWIKQSSIKFNESEKDYLYILFPNGCDVLDTVSKKNYRASKFSENLKPEDIILKALNDTLADKDKQKKHNNK